MGGDLKLGGEGREADGSAGEGGGDGLKRGRFELAELFENTGVVVFSTAKDGVGSGDHVLLSFSHKGLRSA